MFHYRTRQKNVADVGGNWIERQGLGEDEKTSCRKKQKLHRREETGPET
jgi:hypothetical protein